MATACIGGVGAAAAMISAARRAAAGAAENGAEWQPRPLKEPVAASHRGTAVMPASTWAMLSTRTTDCNVVPLFVCLRATGSVPVQCTTLGPSPASSTQLAGERPDIAISPSAGVPRHADRQVQLFALMVAPQDALHQGVDGFSVDAALCMSIARHVSRVAPEQLGDGSMREALPEPQQVPQERLLRWHI